MLVSETRRPPEDFRPKSVQRRKLYALVTQRNEWVDWNGSTDLIRRGRNNASTKEVDTLDVMQARAEARRKQGSHFFIEVIPVLVLENDEHCLMVGERYTEKPLHGLMKHPGLQGFENLKWSTIFAELMSFCLFERRGFVLVPVERKDVARLEAFSADSPCFHFESVPDRNAASLGWAGNGRVSTEAFDDFMSAIRRKKAYERRRRAKS